MAKTADITNASRFHNLSDRELADRLGHADAVAKAAEAELQDQAFNDDVVEKFGSAPRIRV